MPINESVEAHNVSIRNLKAVLYLNEAKNITRAAHLLGRSRTAVSKAVSDTEKQVGAVLFNRTSLGFTPTREGEVFIRRAQTIAGIFEDLAKEYRRVHQRPRPVTSVPLFTMDIATKRLRQLSLLYDAENIEEAAEAAKQSPSTIYKSVHELEEQLGLTLFARIPNGRILPIEYGEYLCGQVKLCLSELKLALDDVRSIQGASDGVVAIGCLPSMRPFLLPAALSKLRQAYPDLSVRINVEPYTQMARALLHGEIDLIVGGTRPSVHDAGLRTEELALDRVCIISGSAHPLAKAKKVTKQQLTGARWLLPLSGTPSRKIFENCLSETGIEVGANTIETGSTTMLGGILQSDDVLTIGTIYQTHREREAGALAILPFKLQDDEWPLGVTMRRATNPSISAQFFIDILRNTVGESALV